MNGSEKRYVAAYCRVSTERDDQASSFENQKRFFREYIEKSPDWILYEIYADEGITGTTVKKRKAFQKMMSDAEKGCFSLILTKEISRFARNLLDSIYYTRELKRMGVNVWFLNDNINTGDGDAELRLAILSSIAQEESRRTSERVKWGQKRRMEDGVVFGHSLLGYDVKNGVLHLNKTGAETVRRIFHAFAEEEKSLSAIARELDACGIAPKQADKWSHSVLLRILKNEKYCGDLIQKKTITPDYLSHEKKYNHGEEDFVILRDHHEPIISRELFDLTQEKLFLQKKRRKRDKMSRKYPFSGKIYCGICQNRMTARVQNRGDGAYHLWRCSRGHSSLSIRNEDIAEMVHAALKQYEKEWKTVKRAVMRRLSRLYSHETDCGFSRDAEEKLLSLYLSGELEKDEYLAARSRFFAENNRKERFLSEIEHVFSDENFFREMLSSVTVSEHDVRLRFVASSAVFVFDRPARGRTREIILQTIETESERK